METYTRTNLKTGEVDTVTSGEVERELERYANALYGVPEGKASHAIVMDDIPNAMEALGNGQELATDLYSFSK